VAAAAPLAGVMLGGALVAGVAAAGIGIGLAASMRHPAVKAAAVGLKSTISAQVNAIGRDWAPTMVGAIDRIKGAVPGIGSELRSALLPARAYVEPLLQGFLNLIRNVMPGFRDILASARPVVDAIANGLAGLGTDIGDTFSDLSQYSDEFASGLQAAFMIAGGLVRIGGGIIAWLANVYRGTLDWGVALTGILGAMPGIGAPFKAMNADLKDLQRTANGTQPAVEGLGGSLQGTGNMARIAASASAELASRQQIMNGTFAQGIEAGTDLAGVFDLLNGKAQSAEAAELAFEDAIDKATASVKENSRTTNDNTVKGRANRSALLQLAQAGTQRAQTIYEQTLATKGSSAAEAAATRAYNQGRSALIASARQMGMNKTQANAYANSIMGIPKGWNTTIRANNSQAKATIAETRRMLSGIPDEVVNIAMRITGNKNPSAVAHGIAKNMSTGGPVTGQGPKGVDSEPRTLAVGEHVFTDKEVDAMGGHGRVEAFRRSLRAGIPSVPTMPSSPVVSRGGDAHYHIGSITLDASKMRSIQDVIAMIEGIRTTARTRYARGPALAGS
jgi:hypothetical protein